MFKKSKVIKRKIVRKVSKKIMKKNIVKKKIKSNGRKASNGSKKSKVMKLIRLALKRKKKR